MSFREAGVTGRSPEPVPHNGKQLGRSAHRVIGRLLSSGITEPSPEQVMSFAAQEPLLDEPHVYRLAARQRLIAATAIYWRWFLPARTSWRFVDFAVPVEGSDLNLVFQHLDGAVRADELKTGGAPALADTQALDAQIERQLAGGRQKYGQCFCAVRVLLLGAPRRSFVMSSDGARALLFEGGADGRQCG